MTDKQIIIDGVDVSGCDRLIVSGDMGYICNCEEDIHLISSCKNRSNCHYKQLKRKEQECEKLKNKLNPKLKNAHCTYFEGQTGLCRAKEFTKCNPVNCKLYTIDELSTIVDLQQQLNQLKALLKDKYIKTLNIVDDDICVECDKKERCVFYLDRNIVFKNNKKLQAQLDQLKAENEDLKCRTSCITCERENENAMLNVKFEKYKQALDEIEKKLIDFCSNCDGEEDDVCKKGCYYSLIPTFKDIINKAKEQ